MIPYDSAQDPPAPVASVTFLNSNTGQRLDGITMLLDTGAAVSLVPRTVIERLNVPLIDGKLFELEGYDGSLQIVRLANLTIQFCGRDMKGIFAIIDQSTGILGRNVLNLVRITFDGPNQRWES